MYLSNTIHLSINGKSCKIAISYWMFNLKFKSWRLYNLGPLKSFSNHWFDHEIEADNHHDTQHNVTHAKFQTFKHNRPVNLHPLFLIWKHGSVCDPEKKSGPKHGVQKTGCKKPGHCYSKRDEARLPLLFLNKNDSVFCTLLFAPHILDLMF